MHLRTNQGEGVFHRVSRIVMRKLEVFYPGRIKALCYARLGKWSIPIVLLHNPTKELIESKIASETMNVSKQYGFVELIGASVYTEEEALAVIDTHDFDILQVPYNILDRGMAERVFPAAHKANMLVVTRSALLKGALTKKALHLPEELNELKYAAITLKEKLAYTFWGILPSMALRFCLFNPGVDSVIIGVRTMEELNEAINAMEAGNLTKEELALIETIKIENTELLDPRNWPFI